MTDGGIQHELGELSAHVANLDKRFGELLKEERRVHGEIEDAIGAARREIGELRAALKIQQATTAAQRRVQAVIVGVLGMSAGGALLRLWQYLAKLGQSDS